MPYQSKVASCVAVDKVAGAERISDQLLASLRTRGANA